ncbi:hypothetical protein ACQQCD_07200 [Pseudarthrobacter sp. J1763]|uniref:hypothetical protein n=1 Tax=Pseudarthrobacter sp. J1763 TaxID=3420445 RepID=UPI003D29B002
MARQDNSKTPARAPRGNSSRGTSSKRKPSAAVYRRRRLFLVLILLVIVALVVGAVVAISATTRSNGEENANPASSNTAQSPSPTATAPKTPVCDEGLVKVTASTDKESYAANEKPKLTLKVSNEGKVACPLNLGTSQMEFLISSGQDRIFSSRDCLANPTNLSKTLAPGASETATFVWERNRSAEGCVAVNATPGAGGATYIFQATLGTRTSPKAPFQLK